MDFEIKSLENFWASQMKTFPYLENKSPGGGLPFVIEYLCKLRFSSVFHS